MLRGGAMLHDTSTSASAQMAADGPSGSGARKSAALLGGFNKTPFIFNEDVSYSSYEEVLAQSDPVANSICSFQIPNSSAPGVYYSLADYSLEINMTRNNIGDLAHSFLAQHMTSCLLWDKVSCFLSGVEISDECTGNQHFSDATKIFLSQEHTQVPYGGNYFQPAGTTDGSRPLNGATECEFPTSVMQSGVGSIEAVTDGQLVRAIRPGANRYRLFVDKAQGGEFTIKYMPQHPLLTNDQQVLLPASLDQKWEFHKARGRSGNTSFEFATTHSGAVGAAAFNPTVNSIRLFVKKVVTTEAGLRAWKSLLSTMNHITIPVIRNVVTTYQIAAGATSISISQMGSKRPRALALWAVPSASQVLDANGRLPTDTNPLQCERGNLAGNSTGAALRFSSLRVRIGMEDYPRTYEISRSNNGRGLSNGTATRDYNTQYLQLCKAYQDNNDLNKPFVSQPSMDAGAYQVHFINTSPAGDAPIFEHRQPGGEEVTQIQLIASLNAPVAENVTLAVVAIHSTSVEIDPIRGTVQKGW